MLVVAINVGDRDDGWGMMRKYTGPGPAAQRCSRTAAPDGVAPLARPDAPTALAASGYLK